MNARLSQPFSTSDDGEGGYYIADSGNFAIRRVLANGSITSVAGGNGFGYGGEYGCFKPVWKSYEYCIDLSIGDGGPPTLARLATPSATILDNTGSLWISEVRSQVPVTYRVRLVVFPPCRTDSLSPITVLEPRDPSHPATCPVHPTFSVTTRWLCTPSHGLAALLLLWPRPCAAPLCLAWRRRVQYDSAPDTRHGGCGGCKLPGCLRVWYHERHVAHTGARVLSAPRRHLFNDLRLLCVLCQVQFGVATTTVVLGTASPSPSATASGSSSSTPTMSQSRIPSSTPSSTPSQLPTTSQTQSAVSASQTTLPTQTSTKVHYW